MCNSENRYYTEDEMVSFLQHTKQPVILVEGKSDVSAYLAMERRLELLGALIPCGCRNTLIAVFKRREEFPNAIVAFIADRDMYYFDGIPEDLAGIIFTTGYSIENDIIADSKVFELYDDIDKAKESYDYAKQEISIWWAFQIQEHKAGKECVGQCSIKELLPAFPKKCEPNNTIYSRHGQDFKNPPQRLIDSIRCNFPLAIRGHQLEELHQLLRSNINKDSMKTGRLCSDLSRLNPSIHYQKITSAVQSKLGINANDANNLNQTSNAHTANPQ